MRRALQSRWSLFMLRLRTLGVVLATGALACIATSATAKAETRALLVGVSSYRYLDPSQHLKAPSNDVEQMRALLLGRGVARGNVTLLADKVAGAPLPTRERILAEIRRLQSVSRPGDLAVIYLSGHGSFQPDGPDHDEEDGIDEVFLPYDVDIRSPHDKVASIKNAIIDDELGVEAARFREAGVDLWFILDSCFSGTGLRVGDGSNVKMIDPSLLGVDVLRASTKAPDGVRAKNWLKRPGGDRASRSPAGVMKPGRSVFFYASQSHQTSRELTFPFPKSPERTIWRSAFTNMMATALSRRPMLSYGAVIDEANRLMREDRSLRITQIAGYDAEGGMADAAVLGGNASAAAAEWRISGNRIAAGVLQGLDEGTILRLFKAPAAPLSESVGFAIVKRASASDATIDAIREFPCPVVDGLQQCRTAGVIDGANYARFAFSAVDLAVNVTPPRSLANAKPELLQTAVQSFQRLKDNGAVLEGRVAFDESSPDLVWWVTDTGFRISPRDVVPADMEAGAADDFTAETPAEQVDLKVARLLLRAARLERLRRLQALAGQRDGEGQSDIAVSLSFLSRALRSNGTCASEIRSTVVPGADLPGLLPCTVVRVEIRNASDKAYFVGLYFIDDDANIRRLSCATADTSGTGASLVANGRRECTLPYGAPRGPEPGVRFARNGLLVLFTPDNQGLQPDFRSIEMLNNAGPGQTARGSADLTFDRAVMEQSAETKGSSRSAPSVILLEWNLDRHGAPIR
jgi:hypothetical protein